MNEETRKFVKNILQKDYNSARKNLIRALKDKILTKIRATGEKQYGE